ncbi:MAG TPA: hypothetical protein VI248_13415 [Kineosporiaceae bacterium]
MTPRDGRGSRVPEVVLAVACAALAVVVVATWWLGRESLDMTHQAASSLKARHLAHEQRRASYQLALDARFRAADLEGGLAAVAEADHAVTNYLNSGALGTGEQLRRWLVLESTCLSAVLAYDHAAGAFSAQVRRSFDAYVNMSGKTPLCVDKGW